MMDNGELKAYLESVIDTTNEKNIVLINSYKELTLSAIGATNLRLDEIVKQNEIRNHRIDKAEDRIEDVKREAAIGAANCKFIQDSKAMNKRDNDFKTDRKIAWQKWIIGILVTLFLGYVGWLTKTSSNKFPVELIYEATDSTIYMPKMYFRNNNGEYMEIHKDYLNIKR